MIVPLLPQPGTHRIPAERSVRAREVLRVCTLHPRSLLSLAVALLDRNTRDQSQASILSNIRPASGSAVRPWRKACHNCAQEKMLDRVGREKGYSFRIESFEVREYHASCITGNAAERAISNFTRAFSPPDLPVYLPQPPVP